MIQTEGIFLGRKCTVITQIGILARTNISDFVKNAMRFLMMMNDQHAGFMFCPKEGWLIDIRAGKDLQKEIM